MHCRKKEIDELVMDAVEKRPKTEPEKEKPVKKPAEEDGEKNKKASPKKKATKSEECKLSN